MDLLGILVAVQGIATLGIDLGRRHASNPGWPGHARFHVVWQSASTAGFAIATEYILFTSRLPEGNRFLVAGLLTAVPMVSFVAALLARSAFQGTLRDTNGASPLIVRVGGRRREVDLNVVAVGLGLSVLGFIGWLHQA